MKKIRYCVAAFVLTILPGSYLALAQQNGSPQHAMTFFVTSVGLGQGADLGGLAGADAHCQALATAVRAGNHTWHAYSAHKRETANQRSMRGTELGKDLGTTRKVEMIASDLAHLHGDTLEMARSGNNVNKLTALTEKGEIVPGLNDNPDPKDRTWAYGSKHPNSNRHEMLTDSQTDGRAYTDNIDHTCGNWTIGTDQGLHDIRGGDAGTAPAAEIGLSDRNGGGNGSWNSSHPTRGCSQEALPASHGVGLFYCFATN